MENQKEEKVEKKDLWQRMKSKIAIILAVVVGFWIGGGIGVGLYLDNYRLYLLRDKNSAWVGVYADILEKQMEAEKNDFIGGDTPEETVDLFVEALKKEDYELAVKYFAVEEQEKWTENFATPNKKNLEEWIAEIESNEKTWHKEVQSEDKVEFWYNVKEGEPSRDINLRKNVNNKWKLRGL
jgi:tRNA U34 2-thiouridine synthase MnmA/TrmU